MPKYIIERDVPGAGQLTVEQLQAMSQQSCQVLEDLGPRINWVHSYVSADKFYCVYIAPDEAMIEEHARRGGFPVNRIERVNTVIDPATADTPTEAAPSA